MSDIQGNTPPEIEEDTQAAQNENTVQEADSVKQKSGFRERIPYQALLLGGFALAASTLLATGNETTKEGIALRLQEDLLSSLEQVVPTEVHDNDLLKDTLVLNQNDGSDIKIYRGLKDNKISALAYGMTTYGYGGAINVIMGVDHSGEILGVRVINHAETPGLGDKIEVAKNDWITKFNGLSFGNLLPDQWKVKKDGGHFDQFSGATITPRAVVKAVKAGLDFFEKNKTTLLKTGATDE